MADETPEQIAAHRDQLKAENDRLNPEVDRLRAQADTLVQAHRDAKAESERLAAELVALRQQLDEERQGRAADAAASSAALAGSRAEHATAVSEAGTHQRTAERLRADYLALSQAATGALKPLLDVLESVRARNV